MAAITTYHHKSQQPVIANNIGSGTATPSRINQYLIKIDVATTGDTLDANAVLDTNIAGLVELTSSKGTLTGAGGTSIYASGTSVIFGITGTQWAKITATLT